MNKFIRLRHFHIESLWSFTDALQPQEFMTLLDLTEAYLHILIFPGHRRFLRFCVGNLQLQFKALPFSLFTAPRVFTKVLINQITFLRQQGIHIHLYFDDLLIWPSSAVKAREDTKVVILCLQNHRFLLKKRVGTYSVYPAPGHDYRHSAISVISHPGQNHENKNTGLISHRQDPFETYAACETPRPPNGKHRCGPVGLAPLQISSMVPETVPGSDCLQV